MTDIILFLTYLSIWFFITSKIGVDVVKGLKGDNKEWDAPEFIIFAWLICFIVWFGAALFLHYKITDNLQEIMIYILLAALGGRGLIDYINKKK